MELRLLFCACAVVGSMTSLAWATPDELVAQQAFEDGRALFRDGKVAEACDRFAVSQRLQPKLGTLLNLAICHQKQGKLTTAWSEFFAARANAASDKRPDRVEFAEARMAEIAPQLAHVRVHIDPTNKAAGTVVMLDDSRVDDNAYDTNIPVDRGPHKVSVSAPGREPWSSELDMAGAGDSKVVDVPTLTSLPPPPSNPPPRVLAHPRRTAGWVTASVGVGGIGAGSVFGVLAILARNDAESLCAQNRCAEGRSKNNTGRSFAWVSDVALGVGVVALVTGIVLVLTDKNADVRVGFDRLVFRF